MGEICSKIYKKIWNCELDGVSLWERWSRDRSLQPFSFSSYFTWTIDLVNIFSFLWVVFCCCWDGFWCLSFETCMIRPSSSVRLLGFLTHHTGKHTDLGKSSSCLSAVQKKCEQLCQMSYPHLLFFRQHLILEQSLHICHLSSCDITAVLLPIGEFLWGIRSWSFSYPGRERF